METHRDNAIRIRIKYSGMLTKTCSNLKMKIMNKITQFSCILGLLLLAGGCKDDDKIRIPDYLTGANMRIVVDPDHQQIDFDEITTDFFAFDAYSENTDLSSVVFTATYKTQTVTIASFTQADFDDGHVRVELDAADFAGLFNVPGFQDGSAGGNFFIRPLVTLNDGRVYPDYVHISPTDSILNLGTAIIGSSATGAFTVQVLTAITCPPRDISGQYLVVEAKGTSTDGCCPGEVTVSGNLVTITAVNETTFAVSDITGGLYLEWYDVYGITAPEDSPGRFAYNCQEVNITNTVEPFGTAVSGGGTYDPATGLIQYSWLNGYGDQATVTLQKQ